MSITLPDGRTLDVVLRPDDPGESAEVTAIAPIRRRDFDSCPICGDPATSEEHVPPARLGGKVLTMTCLACNNKLGSNVEADLVDWFEGAVTLPSFRSAGVRGRRREKRILFRNTPDGEFVLVFNGRANPDVTAMLESGEIALGAVLPDWNRCSLALLKHTYLAACLTYGVLEGEAADEIRRDLVAARDAENRRSVPASRMAAGLMIFRTYEPITDEPAIRAVLHDPAGPVEGVLLVGRIFVSWSSVIPVDVPRAEGRLNRQLLVGLPVEGTVTSVQTAAGVSASEDGLG
jgi:hypothetical protein